MFGLGRDKRAERLVEDRLGLYTDVFDTVRDALAEEFVAKWKLYDSGLQKHDNIRNLVNELRRTLELTGERKRGEDGEDEKSAVKLSYRVEIDAGNYTIIPGSEYVQISSGKYPYREIAERELGKQRSQFVKGAKAPYIMKPRQQPAPTAAPAVVAHP